MARDALACVTIVALAATLATAANSTTEFSDIAFCVSKQAILVQEWNWTATAVTDAANLVSTSTSTDSDLVAVVGCAQSSTVGLAAAYADVVSVQPSASAFATAAPAVAQQANVTWKCASYCYQWSAVTAAASAASASTGTTNTSSSNSWLPAAAPKPILQFVLLHPNTELWPSGMATPTLPTSSGVFPIFGSGANASTSPMAAPVAICQCIRPAYYVTEQRPINGPSTFAACTSPASEVPPSTTTPPPPIAVFQAQLRCPAFAMPDDATPCGRNCRSVAYAPSASASASSLSCCRPKNAPDDNGGENDGSNFSTYRNIIQYMLIVIICLSLVEGCIYGAFRVRRRRREQAAIRLAGGTGDPLLREPGDAATLAGRLMEIMPTTVLPAAAPSCRTAAQPTMPQAAGAVTVTAVPVGSNSSGTSPRRFAEDSSQPCPICLEPYGNLPVTELPCGHVLHGSCMRDYITHRLQQSNDVSCPTCRGGVFEGMSLA